MSQQMLPFIPSALNMAGDSAFMTSISPVIIPCANYQFPTVVCVEGYGSILPQGFYREVHEVIGDADTYPSTHVPNDPSFKSVQDSQFVVFNRDLGPQILGDHPRLDFMFEFETAATHEGPVYVPDSHELFISRLEHNYLYQLVISLTNDPPTISERIANPPIYGGAGARYHNGVICYAALGGGEDVYPGMIFRPGIYALNVSSGESMPLVNNYYGYFFNSVDDIDISPDGDIWFTDNDYAYSIGVNPQPPQLHTGTYRFTPSTGEVRLVESSLVEPNGIAFSPCGSIVYISDTAAGSAFDSEGKQQRHLRYKSTGPRTIYAFDVDPEDRGLHNKRPIYQSLDYVPDGVKVSRDGYIVTATGHGLDVLTPNGSLVVRVLTNFTVVNIAFVGLNGEELWAVGKGGVARVRWGLRGPRLQ